ncbi:MAG: Rrf2 family transcriptional regulator [Clostridiales bacterium]|nr:Rrf2 family transcriptional regulator [Clostridiales bacterium]
MKISTKGRYALRFMIDLAINYNDKYVSLKEVSDRQEISMKYLEAIVSLLHKAGFVESARGNAGGYRLAKKPDECVIADILIVTEGSIAPIACLEGGVNQCPRAGKCLTLPLWQGLDRVIYDYLANYTVADLVCQEYNI